MRTGADRYSIIVQWAYSSITVQLHFVWVQFMTIASMNSELDIVAGHIPFSSLCRMNVFFN